MGDALKNTQFKYAAFNCIECRTHYMVEGFFRRNCMYKARCPHCGKETFLLRLDGGFKIIYQSVEKGAAAQIHASLNFDASQVFVEKMEKKATLINQNFAYAELVFAALGQTDRHYLYPFWKFCRDPNAEALRTKWEGKIPYMIFLKCLAQFAVRTLRAMIRVRHERTLRKKAKFARLIADTPRPPVSNNWCCENVFQEAANLSGIFSGFLRIQITEGNKI
jgi:hypothetical protein